MLSPLKVLPCPQIPGLPNNLKLDKTRVWIIISVENASKWHQRGQVTCLREVGKESVGKESACNAGDPGSIPGSGRSAGEGIGCPLQYSWASLVAQLGKNLPAMQETWVPSLDWEDALEKGKATHSSILAWRIPWTVYSPWGHKESDMTE